MARHAVGNFTVQSQVHSSGEFGEATRYIVSLSVDLANVSSAERIFELAASGQVRLTPPPKPVFEEEMLLSRVTLEPPSARFLRQELGGILLRAFAQAGAVHLGCGSPPDASPGGNSELNLTDWRQLKLLSQRERD